MVPVVGSVGDGRDWSLDSIALDMVDRKVGGGHTETHGVRDVVDSLDETVGVHIAVTPSGDTVGGLHFLLDRVRVAVTVVVLADVVLCVVLGVGGVNGSDHRSGGDNRSSSDHRCGNSLRQRVGVVRGVGQVGVGHLRSNHWSRVVSSSHRSSSIGSGHNWSSRGSRSNDS